GGPEGDCSQAVSRRGVLRAIADGEALTGESGFTPMSVATAEPGLTHELTAPEEMPDGITPRGIALSVALHLVLGTVFILGLPRLFDPPMLEDMPVAVQLVTIAPETRATRPNPNPRPNAKPDPPVADAALTKPEPEPPVPTPVPPPSTEMTSPPELVKPPEP